jgi:hypothetical protein
LPAVQFAGRQPQTDLSPGAWVAAATAGEPWLTVAALLPRGFAATARVFHPAYRYDGDDDVEVTWREIAEENRTTPHPLMQWPGITGGWEYCAEESQPPVWDRAPDEGHLPTELAARLAAVLRRHTTAPDDCWFGIWVGGVVLADAPALALPNREHWLVRGPVELAAANLAAEPAEQSAHLWWPADHAWCVATDIDLMSTYVGGSAACIAELLATPGIEAAPVTPDDGVDFASDMLNPVPPRI